MKGRGPRGRGGQDGLQLIAWGEVAWDGTTPYWAQVGGEFEGIVNQAANLNKLPLLRPHDPARLVVQISQIYTIAVSGQASEVRASRTPQSVSVIASVASVPFSILVYEER